MVVPCFNHGQYLPEALESVRACPAWQYELVVVDDGSDDALTLDVLERLERDEVRVLRQPNRGLAAARNAGVAATTGRYVLPLDSDNRVRPRLLEAGIEVLDREPGTGVVYGDPELFGDRAGRREVGSFDLERLVRSNFIDACAVVRRNLIDDCGGFDWRMPHPGNEDWQLWLCAAERGWAFHYVPEILFDYRVRGDSMLASLKVPERRAEVFGWIVAQHPELYGPRYPQILADRDAELARQSNEARAARAESRAARREAERARAEVERMRRIAARGH